MKIQARNDANLKLGDGCIVLFNFHHCGGPKTGEYREHSARKPISLPDGGNGKASHKVVRGYDEHDQPTNNNFKYVECEEI